ncbi:hypothetical protein KP509_34G066700 [Ceratopteris richardii]|uniref:Uncharacterized protein n=1 Tax=Ceratopteris richardii TaxID=49495 RepID=A0A8T2QN01_CERRI|nr:hypothetical protein KP509_34G066700 [Ceratopteris richardii]
MQQSRSSCCFFKVSFVASHYNYASSLCWVEIHNPNL